VAANPFPEQTEIPLEVEVLDDSSSIAKDVRTEQGDFVGRVTIPPSSGGAVLVLNKASKDVFYIDAIASDVVDINVVDNNGSMISEFDDEDVEVCFATSDYDEGDVCLGFFNVDRRWECQDFCLSSKKGDTGDDMLCGNTDHLTNFALLLSPEAGTTSRCGSSSDDLTYAYWSLALVGVAIIVIAAVVIARELFHRYDTHMTDKRLTYNAGSGSGGTNGAAIPVMPSFHTD